VESFHETLIIGAGPAGLQLGALLQRTGRDYLILESGDTPGTFFRHHPRQRRLISINKIHTGYDDPEIILRWDWNSLLSEGEGPFFSEYTNRYFPSADTLVQYLADWADRHRIAVQCGTRVVRVSREDAHFRLEDDRGRRYGCSRLVIATGLSATCSPALPGIELAERYIDVSTDPTDYTNQRVLVLGKGNSAFEIAEHLTETAAIIHVMSPAPLKMAWQTHHVGHLRAINNNFLDTYQLKCQNAVLDATAELIERRDDGRLGVTVHYTHAGNEREELVYDRVINCTGFRFDISIFDDSCQPALTLGGRLPAQTSSWESVNVPDLYFAGTLMQARDYKKSASAFIHGFRYNVRTLHRLLEQRYHRQPLPSEPVARTVETLEEAILARCNRSSALWQQFGFLSDVVVFAPGAREGRYYWELPMDYIREGALGDNQELYTISLEFGPSQADPFRIERNPVPARAHESTFLHPVIRRFLGTIEVAALHLLENLYGEWHDDHAHRAPLRAFLEAQLKSAAQTPESLETPVRQPI
jgi:thioredoxin reductase